MGIPVNINVHLVNISRVAIFTIHRTPILKILIYIYLQKTMFTLPHFSMPIRNFMHVGAGFSCPNCSKNTR